MSIPSRLTAVRAVATVAIAVVVIACSSAASAAPAGGVVATAAVTPAAAATSPGAPTASPTFNPTLNDFITASPSITAPPSGPLGTPVLVDPFTSAGIATTVDTAAHAVDPSTYRSTLPGAEYKSVYVVFALKPDTVGKVTMVMTLNDVEVLDQPLSIDYGTINSWGDFKVNFPDSGIPLGLYKAVMTFEPTGAQVVQYFAVT